MITIILSMPEKKPCLPASRGEESGGQKKEKSTVKMVKRVSLKAKKSAKNGAVKSKVASGLKKNHGQFDVDHFLIDEQIYCSERLRAALEKQEQKVQPVLNDLDKIILGGISANRVSESVEKVIIGNGLKVSFNKAGQFLGFTSKGLLFNSAYTVDLRKKQLVKKPPVGAEKENYFLNELRISQPVLDIPSPSLLKRQAFKDWLKRISQLPKNIFAAFLPPRKFFLPKASPKTISRQLPWLNRLKVALNFALIALLFIVPIRGVIIYNQIKDAKIKVLGATEEALTDLQEGMAAISATDWNTASLNFAQSNDYFNQAQVVIAGYNQSLLSFFEDLPLTSKQINDGKALLNSGQLMAQAATKLSLIINQINQQASLEATVSQSLAEIQDNLHQVIDNLRQALSNLAGVSPQALPDKYRESFKEIQKNLPLLLNNLTETDKLLNFSSDFLGLKAAKRYLFNYQNNNELRATGGFLGSYALVDISKGKIKNMEVPGGGYYDLKGDFLEKVISPQPMHLLGTPWMIWDANWWPDYPASMKKLLWFYEKSGGPSVDGVITFNASILPAFLKITGNISLPEYNQLLTPDNVILALQHETEFEYNKKENQPKKIIGDLMKKILEKLMSVSPEQIMPLVATLKDSLAAKDIQLYFTDDKLENQVKDFGWDGGVAVTDKDYLMVVRTNVSGGKTDGVIKQEIKHYAYLQDDNSLVDSVAIKLTHQGNKNDVFERVLNKSYIRVYVPEGSQFLEASGYDGIDPTLFKEVYPGYLPDKDLERINGQIQIDPKTNTVINNELGKTVFGNWLLLQPGESKTLTFSYRLPFKLDFQYSSFNRLLEIVGLKEADDNQNYSLLAQNQSGPKNTILESVLSLPNSRTIVWSGSSGKNNLNITANSLNFKTELNKDYKYGVLIR